MRIFKLKHDLIDATSAIIFLTTTGFRMSKYATTFDTALAKRLRRTLVIVFALLVAGFTAFWAFSWQQSKTASEQAALEECKHTSDLLRKLRVQYTKDVVMPAIASGMSVSSNHVGHDDTIPLPATFSMELGSYKKRESTAKSSLYSPYPFPDRKETGGLDDQFRKDAWAALSKDPATPFYRVEDASDGRVLRFATADILHQSCVSCHNTHPDTPKSDWKVGDTRGVLEVSVPMSLADDRAEGYLQSGFLFSSVLVLLATTSFVIIIGNLRKGLSSLNDKAREKDRDLQKVIIDKSKALDKLLTSKVVMQAALDASHSMIWITDTDGNITNFSGYLKEFTELSPRELYGESWTTFIANKETNKVVKEWEAKTNKEVPFTIKCSLENKSGELRTHEIVIAPVRKLAGRLIGWIGTGTDITDHLSAVGELEERLKSEKLDSQKGKLESIGRLAAGIAHEINTPVQYVTDNLNFLKGSQDDLLKLIEIVTPDAAGRIDVEGIAKLIADVDFEFLKQEIPTAIEETLDGANRIAEIVSAMKDFSHPGSEEMQAADLNKLINSTVVVSRARWKYSSELSMSFDNSLPSVECHPGEINQVMLNLIVNAADAIKENRGENKELGHIEIATTFDGHNAYVTVKDDGGGIPDAVQNQIFDPFFTTKEVGKGTGQGLSICRSIIVEKHGGDLSFDVEDGSTTFKITLPLKQN